MNPKLQAISPRPGIGKSPIGSHIGAHIPGPNASRLKVQFQPVESFSAQIKPRPLVALNAAMCELDATADKVRALLDEGKLAGFDIATKRGKRSCLRILHASIQHCRQSGRKRPFIIEWHDLFKLVWPYTGTDLRGDEMARSLNCDRGHIEDLINAEMFHVVKRAQPGPHGSPIVTLASFEAFLKGRLL